MITVTLYTKDNCSLCETAKQDLQALQEKIPHTLALVNIEEDPDLKAAYGTRVPVAQVGPYFVEAPFDRRKLEMTMAAARDRAEQIEGDPKYDKRKARSAKLTGSDRLAHFLGRHYLALLNLIVFLYVGLPFLAPVLMNAGYPGLARPIYSTYGAVCHQMAYRSWFLFGDQPVYPREAAGMEGYVSYEAVTGLNGEDMLSARRFIGDEQVGYKVAFCQRDVAIYGAILVFGLLYAATGRRIKPLHWMLWIAIGFIPIGLDGFSQLLSQIPGWSFWEYRESTPLLRTLTGAIFGFTTAWFGIPLLEESFQDVRVQTASKKARIASSKNED
ncbi:MAG: DUF2085 domain-containing protein [Anaerolineales bacterium]|nr:MAG: DUF2085 domain-containing protein [Anaerolineales bacterium]